MSDPLPRRRRQKPIPEEQPEHVINEVIAQKLHMLVPFPCEALDAVIQVFTDMAPLDIVGKRIQLSSGSVAYDFAYEIAADFGGGEQQTQEIYNRDDDYEMNTVAIGRITIETITSELTHIVVFPEDGESDDEEQAFETTLKTLVKIFIIDIDSLVKAERGKWISTKSALFTNQIDLTAGLDTIAYNRRGRPSYAEDIWAWEQMNIHGRPRKDVRAEWEQRLSREVQDKNRAFRRVVAKDRTDNES